MKAFPLATDTIRSIAARKAVLVLAGIGILAASAWLSVPFYPVPLTMQTLAVLLIGGALGPAMGVSSVIGYLALGAAGAPVFHGGLGGAIVLAGPTGGYLVGFIPAVFVMGWAAHLAGRRTAGASTRAAVRRMVVLAAGALLASAVIYLIGVPAGPGRRPRTAPCGRGGTRPLPSRRLAQSGGGRGGRVSRGPGAFAAEAFPL
jgi:biotin transport system substrate-specific component